MRVLLISNGHGEDAVGAHLGRRLRELCPGWQLQALPLVGLGRSYERLGIALLEPRRELPSGGVVRLNLRRFWSDLRQGWWALRQGQLRTLGRLADQVHFAVVCGDIYALLTASHLRQPLYYVQTLVSEYYWRAKPWWEKLTQCERLFVDHFTPLERCVMRRRVALAFVRDQLSADYLRSCGLEMVRCHGNPLMDAFDATGWDLSPLVAGTCIALLPGSRSDAYWNLSLMLQAAQLLAHSGLYTFMATLADGFDLQQVQLPEDWRLYQPHPALVTQGVAAIAACHPARVYLVSGRFGDILQACRLVIGTGGTANEQAAGLGKPVVGFWGPGPQYPRRFAIAQKRLLGEALQLFPPDPGQVAQAVQRLLADGQLYVRAAQAGQERMAGRGRALEQTAQEIVAHAERRLYSSRAS
ncbi:MAG: hypothetical protein HY335_10020 [Deinococcus sp.]|nr:hypothetical protein [Deinococcus sp.]